MGNYGMVIKKINLFFVTLLTVATSINASVSTLTYHNQHITYVGTEHSYNPKEAQYDTLIQAWNSFLQKTGGKNCCVIIEQPTIVDINLTSLEEAITQHGDCGAGYYLARQANIPLIAGDPLVHLAFPILAKSKKWLSEYVQYTYFIQQLELYNRIKKENPTFDKPILEAVERKVKALFPETSINNLIQLHEQLTNRLFDPYDHHFFQYLTYFPPIKSLRGLFVYHCTALKEIRDIVSNYHLKRDIATVALIKQQLLAGNNIFIVYGKTHEDFHLKGLQIIIKNAVTQEPAT